MKGLKFAVVGLLGCASGSELRALGSGDYNWGQQGNDWTGTCTSSARQSPLDLKTSTFSALPSSATQLSWVYTSEKLELDLVHDGKDIEITSFAKESFGTLNFNGTKYDAVQLHFHAASEHLVDSVRRPLELHVIHSNIDATQFTVTGFFFIEGTEENAYLKAIIDSAPTFVKRPASGQKDKVTLNKKSSNFPNLNMVFPKKAEVWHYDGSLTTPGCNEIVNWLVFPTPLVATRAQLAKFAKPMLVIGEDSGNFRLPVNDQNNLFSKTATKINVDTASASFMGDTPSNAAATSTLLCSLIAVVSTLLVTRAH